MPDTKDGRSNLGETLAVTVTLVWVLACGWGLYLLCAAL